MLLSRTFLRSVGVYAALITASVMGVFIWGLADPGRAVTMSFMTLAFAQIFTWGTPEARQHVLHPRHVIANGYALGAALLAAGLQVATMYVEPLSTILGVHRLTLMEWGIVGVASAFRPSWARARSSFDGTSVQAVRRDCVNGPGRSREAITEVRQAHEVGQIFRQPRIDCPALRQHPSPFHGPDAALVRQMWIVRHDGDAVLPGRTRAGDEDVTGLRQVLPRV